MAEKREVQVTDEKIAEKLMECEQLAAQLVSNNSSVMRASQGEVEKANQILAQSEVVSNLGKRKERERLSVEDYIKEMNEWALDGGIFPNKF